MPRFLARITVRAVERARIELIVRRDEPDAVPAVLDLPQAERLWSRFNLRSLIPYGELQYDPTRRRFFGLCVRPCQPVAVPVPVALRPI